MSLNEKEIERHAIETLEYARKIIEEYHLEDAAISATPGMVFGAMAVLVEIHENVDKVVKKGKENGIDIDPHVLFSVTVHLMLTEWDNKISNDEEFRMAMEMSAKRVKEEHDKILGLKENRLEGYF